MNSMSITAKQVFWDIPVNSKMPQVKSKCLCVFRLGGKFVISHALSLVLLQVSCQFITDHWTSPGVLVIDRLKTLLRFSSWILSANNT